MGYRKVDYLEQIFYVFKYLFKRGKNHEKR